MSDDSSAVVAVEPIDQAPAEVPSLADILAARDFTQFPLNGPCAPMVTVSLEEPALAPARTLVRVPYLEHLLALVQRGCEQADSHTASEPAFAQAHADLATYLATILVGLFDPARLALLPEALADYRSLGDPTVVTRALLAQINYIVDVAANMRPNTHTTASGVFRFAWRGKQTSTTIVVRLRTVNMYIMYLPQPVASCLRPPETTPLPTLALVLFHPSAPSPVDFVHARWKFEYPLRLPAPFVEWYQSKLRFVPRLMAACANCRISAQRNCAVLSKSGYL